MLSYNLINVYISWKKGGVFLAAIDSAYHYYLSTYGTSKVSRYDTHKKSQLRAVYNQIVKTNKDTPLYKIPDSTDVTNYLHNMSVGDEILVRGPYGNHFPVETVLKGQDLLFIAGGIGLAPLRSVINYVRDNRENYGKINIVYGSRSKDDLVDYQEILDEWSKDCKVDLTIDREQEGWDGHVGFIPNYVKELKPDLNRTVLICGPPIMIKFTLDGLKELGFQEEQVYTTMELRMKCGIGKCGRCNIGDKYVCKDGPVFRFDELSELPNEY